MLVIPAIDLKEGSIVELGDGPSGQGEVSFGDPRDVARRWSGHGFLRLQVMDLDAEAGRGSNHATIRDLLADNAAPMQVGGGVRSTEDVERLLADGAERVVVGARAIDEPGWLREIADVNPGAIVLAANVRDRRVVARGWAHELPRDMLDLIDDLAGVPLGGLLVAAVRGEGLAARTDLPLMEDIAEASNWPVLAAGVIESMADLRALEERGLAGAVVGMALYSGALDPRILAEEFAV